MTHLLKRSFLLFPIAILSSCSFLPYGNEPLPATESGTVLSSESTVPLVTRNVSYMGTIDALQANAYLQGTHRLTLSDGQFILLESTDGNLSLNAYLGKHVEVRGSVQPTVEGSGEIMRVEEITILETATSDSGTLLSSVASSAAFCGGIAGIPCKDGLTCVDNPNDDCNPTAGGADCSGICVAPLATQSSSSSSSAASSVASSKSSVSSKAVPVPTPSSSASISSSSSSRQATDPQVSVMSKQDYATDGLWTQKYCTSHIGFCIPAHKNWYFKSFGATTSNLWHVEFGMNAIDELHSGAIVLNLVSGTLASMSAKDGQIKAEGSDVIGFKDWTNGTHFELIADAGLKDAVSYMLAHIVPYATQE